MADYFNEDFRDFLRAFNKAKVEYILVGGMAVILHGYVRTTGDWIFLGEKNNENYLKTISTLNEFGMPAVDMNLANFLSDKFDVWSFGRKPVLIEIMTKVKGLDFEDAFSTAVYYEEDGISIRFLHLNSLLLAKKAAGRYKDLDDIDQLSKK